MNWPAKDRKDESRACEQDENDLTGGPTSGSERVDLVPTFSVTVCAAEELSGGTSVARERLVRR